MKKLSVILAASFVILMAACATRQAAPKPAAPRERVGVYDSRAIVIAYAGSAHFNAWLTNLKAKNEKAKAEGDEQTVKATEEEGQGRQRKMHSQGFSTAPVDDILAVIQDQLPEIAKKAGVGPLISKWDTVALAKHPGAEQVDITMALVEALKPNERQLKIIPEMLKTQPLPLEEIEKMPVDE